ncbi:hypothetical protein M0804_002594 [Polistes exclamans]|nr:hypothetical protein M0804_002594 [Polistes exclamans]
MGKVGFPLTSEIDRFELCICTGAPHFHIQVPTSASEPYPFSNSFPHSLFLILSDLISSDFIPSHLISSHLISLSLISYHPVALVAEEAEAAAAAVEVSHQPAKRAGKINNLWIFGNLLCAKGEKLHRNGRYSRVPASSSRKEGPGVLRIGGRRPRGVMCKGRIVGVLAEKGCHTKGKEMDDGEEEEEEAISRTAALRVYEISLKVIWLQAVRRYPTFPKDSLCRVEDTPMFYETWHTTSEVGGTGELVQHRQEMEEQKNRGIMRKCASTVAAALSLRGPVFPPLVHIYT